MKLAKTENITTIFNTYTDDIVANKIDLNPDTVYVLKQLYDMVYAINLEKETDEHSD